MSERFLKAVQAWCLTSFPHVHLMSSVEVSLVREWARSGVGHEKFLTAFDVHLRGNPLLREELRSLRQLRYVAMRVISRESRGVSHGSCVTAAEEGSDKFFDRYLEKIAEAGKICDNEAVRGRLRDLWRDVIARKRQAADEEVKNGKLRAYCLYAEALERFLSGLYDMLSESEKRSLSEESERYGRMLEGCSEQAREARVVSHTHQTLLHYFQLGHLAIESE